MLGMRVKLYSKGSGRWEKSGGEAAKFGLTTTELLEVIRRLEEADRMDMLKLLHFHIGSQLTDIKRIKNAMKEAARVYAKVYQMKVPIEFLDVGGGMAVDYDGSKTAFDFSKLHGAGVCQRRHLHDQAGLRRRERSASDDHSGVGPFPRGLSRDPRDERARRDRNRRRRHHADRDHEDDPQVVIELGDLRESITVKNYREYYHDALEHREELFTLFNLGLISLEDRAKGEVLFWDVCERADKYAQQAKYVSEEFGDLRRLLCAKYLTNFSVFRSVPDHWALDQLFPIVPIHHLNKPPTEYTTLCDITCDSDGWSTSLWTCTTSNKCWNFTPQSGRALLPCVHAGRRIPGSDGKQSQPFGAPHEAHIHIDEEGFLIKKVIKGNDCRRRRGARALRAQSFARRFRRLINRRVKDGELSDGRRGVGPVLRISLRRLYVSRGEWS